MSTKIELKIDVIIAEPGCILKQWEIVLKRSGAPLRILLYFLIM